MNDYITIPLTKGQVAVIDADAFGLVSQQRWHAWWNPKTNSFYAHRRIETGGKRPHVFMHRIIMGLPVGLIGKVVDHINHDTLDNRRCNLRVVTYSQNSMNMNAHRQTASGLKGVSATPAGKWQAAIWVSGRNLHLGTFATKEDAHIAYCEAANVHFGEFANKKPQP